MKDNRPVNLDIGTIDLPVTALISISHRVSGVFLFFGTLVLMYLLAESLSGPEGFESAKACLDSFLGKLVVWGVLAGLIFHSVAGCRHFLMDMGIGESLEGGQLTAKIAFGVAAFLIVLAGLWVW